MLANIGDNQLADNKNTLPVVLNPAKFPIRIYGAGEKADLKIEQRNQIYDEQQYNQYF